jgi:hypothetical protein
MVGRIHRSHLFFPFWWITIIEKIHQVRLFDGNSDILDLSRQLC